MNSFLGSSQHRRLKTPQKPAILIEFRFEPPVGTLYISFAAVLVSLLLSGYLALGRKKDTTPEPVPPAQPHPARPAARS
jgi:hypothetical protein